jgi:hypothetical protein
MKTTIDMAYEAGIDWTDFETDNGFNTLKTFEALVRADQRQIDAKVCESEAEMFKSCAYGANDGRYDWKEDGARECATAIRNRGNI